MAKWLDLSGITDVLFRLGKNGVSLKSAGGKLAVRDSGDAGDAALVASAVEIGGGDTVLQSGSPGSTLTLTLPNSAGSPAQVLSTNGAGVLSWATVAGGSDKPVVDTTTLAFGSSSPLSMFTLPANAIVLTVKIIVDTAFDGTPSASIGVSGGDLAKYVPASKIYLDTVDSYTYYPDIAPSGSTEDLIVTYSANSATVGSARILVDYVIPS